MTEELQQYLYTTDPLLACLALHLAQKGYDVSAALDQGIRIDSFRPNQISFPIFRSAPRQAYLSINGITIQVRNHTYRLKWTADNPYETSIPIEDPQAFDHIQTLIETH